MEPPVPGIETILAEAVEIAAADREAFLDRACGGDSALRARVGKLAADHFRAGNFLEYPLAEPTANFDQAAGHLPAGSAVGPYKVRERIGEGGMGAVYVADQEQPIQRRVALKVIKPGMDTREVVARFEAERQALALMDHPNIAKVLDGGATAEGRPYFVMELVRGLPVTEYCDRARLPAHERLVLFAAVCRAVQHAHQKGIIHRDLKPSNVLVTEIDGRPVPRVIDFGVAKATGGRLTDKTVYTGFARLVGTPLYMSPEQAELSGVDVDTRSDVYSLGVLLYELLTGTTPFDGEALRVAGFDEMRRIIREEEPPRPSHRVSTLDAAARSTVSARRGLDERQLGRLLRGDLDWVVMRALEKDRNRRYESAGALAADVERYLADEPVEARPPSTLYRLRKLARRNRAAVISAVLVISAVALGTVTSMWKYMDERTARKEADDNRARADRNADEARHRADDAVRAKGEADAARQEAERQRNAVARNLYFADVRLGLVDWTAGNQSRLSRKLADHVPAPGRDDHRGWEWYYLFSLSHLDERTLLDHEGDVFSVAWSPDGRHVAAAGADRTVRVWETPSWRLVRTLQPSRNFMQGLSWSPDGRWLAWGASEDDNAVYLWRVGTDRVKALRGHTSSVWTTAWHPDGQRLASAGMDSTVRVWEPESGWCLRVVLDPGGYSTKVAWSPDGGRLASANHGDAGLRVWDTSSWQIVREGLSATQAREVAWHPNGKWLALGSADGTCVVYRADDWSEATRWTAHRGEVTEVAWGPDGSWLATAGADNLVKVWKPDGNAELTLRGHRSAVKSVAWDPGGGRLVSGGMDHSVKVWAVAPVPYPRRLPVGAGAAPALAWGEAPDALLTLDAAGGSVAIWDAATGQRRGRTSVATGQSGQFAQGGGQVVVAGPDGEAPRLTVYEAHSGRLVQTVRMTVVGKAVFSPDSSQLAVVNWRKLEVADLSRNEVRFHWGSRGIRAGDWSPDGRLLAVAGNGDWDDGGNLGYAGWLHVFDIALRKRVLKLRHGTSRVIATAVTWSPDGKRLVSGDDSGLVEVHEIPAGRKALSATLHTGRVSALAWSPDGRRVASAGRDRTVRLWDPASGEELLRFDTPDEAVTQLRWSPDGRRLAAAAGSGEVLIWDASPGHRYLQSEAYAREQTRDLIKEAQDLWDQDRKDDSIALRVRALEKQKAALSPDHEDTLANMDGLGTAYRATGRRPEATALHEEVLAKRRAKHGPGHDDTRTSLNNLAVDYLDAGRFQDGIALLEQAISGQWAMFGADDPTAVKNLNWAYRRVGRHQESVSLLERLLEAQKARHGPDHPNTVADTHDLAHAYQDAGRHAEAVALFEQTLEKQKSKPGADPKLTRKYTGCLASAYGYAGQLDRAEPMLVELADQVRKSDGPGSPATAGALAMLGMNRLKQHKYAEAEPVLRECLAIRAEKLPDDWSHFNTLSQLGGALLGQGNYADAEPLLLRGYEGMKQRETQIPPPGLPRLPEAAERLVRLYETTGRPDQAREWRDKIPPGPKSRP